MSKMALALLVTFFLSSCNLAFASTEAPSAKNVKVIRWYIAHSIESRPLNDLIKNYANKIEERSNGSLKVEIQYAEKLDTLDENVQIVAYKKLLANEIEMTQISTTILSQNNFEIRAIVMPHVFRDYNHAEAFFNGPVSERLVKSIYKGSNEKVRAFAFTYSGGYRMLFGSIPLKDLTDFKNIKMRGDIPGRGYFFKSAGAEIVGDQNINGQQLATEFMSGKINADDGEINRINNLVNTYPQAKEKIKHILLTKHNMYSTMIIANEKFFSTLTAEQKDLLSEEMQKLAVEERKLSVELEARNMVNLQDQGITISKLSESDSKKLNELATKFKKKYPNLQKLLRQIAETDKN